MKRSFNFLRSVRRDLFVVYVILYKQAARIQYFGSYFYGNNDYSDAENDKDGIKGAEYVVVTDEEAPLHRKAGAATDEKAY